MAAHNVIAALLAVAMVATTVSATATETVLTPMPLGASDLCAATVNNVTYAFAGAATYQFDGSANKWKTINQGINRITARAATTSSGVTVIAGGGGQLPQANCTLFTVSNGPSFKQCTRMPTPTAWAGVAAVGETVYVGGGFAPVGWNVVQAYDATTNKWSNDIEPLPTPRYGLSAAAVDGVVYFMGGSAWHEPATAVVEAYDTKKKQWFGYASMNNPRTFFASTVSNGKIYVFGGNDASAGGQMSSVEMYDPATNTWTEVEDLPKPKRAHSAATTLENGSMMLLGGTTGKGNYQYSLDNALLYTP